MLPPFRRVAILPENVTDWRTFAYAALKKGADALYLRGYRTPIADTEGLPLILPAGVSYPDQGKVLAFQFGGRIDWRPVKSTLCGASCHNRQEAEKALAAGFDYVFLSPVFPTKTHPDARPLGLDSLREICDQFPALPVFALGGVSAENETACRMAGAHGVAGIRMFS